MSEPDVSDGVRALLADASIWEEPPPALEQEVVDSITRATRERVPAPSRVSRSVSAVAAALILLFGLAAVLAWPSDGGWAHEFALAGTDRAPDASASVTVQENGAGALIRLDAEGLAPAPANSYYEGWVDGPDGDMVAIGTFHLHHGDDPIALWAGVDLSKYPVLTVTLEPEDGDPGSSGDVVLRGSVSP